MLAVMADDCLITNSGPSRFTWKSPEINLTTGLFLRFCKKYQITQLWVTRGCRLWHIWKRNCDYYNNRPDGTDWGYTRLDQDGFTVRPGGVFANMITGWDQSGFRASVYFPGLTAETWPFDEIHDPIVLFDAVNRFTADLGVNPTYPVRAARELADKTLTIKPALLTDDPADFWRPFIDKTESEFIWLREPNRDEKRLSFCHAFDKRMMFLSAARSTSFGVGVPDVIDNVSLQDLGKAVGLVKVDKLEFKNSLTPELNAFFSDLFRDTNIFYTPYLSVLQQVASNDIKIVKGFVWKDPKRIFEPFCKRLSDAIKDSRIDPAFDTPAEMSDAPMLRAVNAAYKTLYVRFFGWLGRLENRSGFAGEYFRPDWRGLIVSQAGANLLRNVLNVFAITRSLPFAINHDCLMYFAESDRADLDFTGTVLTDPMIFTHEWTAGSKQVKKLIKAGYNSGQIDGEFKQ